jgi:nitrate reductase assembly molybdenum cofactor insertion protein NarJ
MGANSAFYQKMHDPEIMLTFKGSVTYDLVSALLTSIEPKLHHLESHLPTRKRLYNVLVECLQNVAHHSDDVATNDEDLNGKVTLLLVTSERDSYCVQTGNTILNSKVDDLKEWLEVINTLSPDELKTAYKKILDQGEPSAKGTAGLGFIDIARKSGQKFVYNFQRMNNDYSIFSFVINVPKTTI